MNAPHLLVWFENGQPQSCELAEVPDALSYNGEVFRADTEYFGDVDYLRDEQKRLVGFSYVSGGKNEKAIWERLLGQSKNVKLDGGMLVILLQPRPYEVDCVQAMGTEIFRSPRGEIIFSVPNWDFGELAFQLTTNNTPISTPLSSGVPRKP
jgi:hypothetical protein